jgi:ferredoxin
LAREQRHKVVIDGCDQSFDCVESDSLLAGMVRMGRRGIPLGCRGGGCGVCKVEVVAGVYEVEKMSRDHVSAEDERMGRVLACRVRPRSDIVLTVIGGMKKAFGVRKGDERPQSKEER